MNVTTPSTSPDQGQPQRPDRTRLWALLVFLMLTLACLAAVVIVVSGGRLPDLGRAEVSWTPPPDVASAPASPGGAPGSSLGNTELRFNPGDAVRIVSAGPVNLRQSPGFQNKPASDVVAAVPANQSGFVVAGPQEADGLVWWRVRFGESEGWMAERSNSGVTLLDRAP